MEKNENILNIGVLTFNHEKFIEKCLNSILEQKTNFPLKIFILDDCSSDNTVIILKEFANKYPENINLDINSKNIGALKSAYKLAKKMQAKYITWLDGDDFWCYEHKLQTQIDFLESNLEYWACFHDAIINNYNDNQDSDFLKRTQIHWKFYSQFNDYQNDFMPWALVARNIIPTASLVFRFKDISDFFDNYNLKEYSLSWALHLFLIKSGKFKFFNEHWSVYNDHPKGLSKTNSIVSFKENNIKILENLLKDKDWDYFKSDIYKSICNEFRFILKTNEELQKTRKEYNKSLAKYNKYLKLFVEYELKQLKDDFSYVRNSRMVE